MKILRVLDSIKKPEKVYAHCDVPCGVYETDSIKHAVETVTKLTEKLLDLKNQELDDLEKMNILVRSVQVKEEYAQICKEQLLILWTDYFKPEHLEKWPNLHDLFWKATKQCSEVKRHVNLEACQKLKELTDQIADIFAESKK